MSLSSLLIHQTLTGVPDIKFTLFNHKLYWFERECLLSLTDSSHDHEDYYAHIMAIGYYNKLMHNITFNKKKS